jgi:glycosyltransferase involved in cell wall biosynthesis
MPALGYLVPEFPSQTHAFFWREVQALRSLGIDVQLLSTKRPDADACRHDFAAQAAAETRYLFPAGIAAISLLLRHPGAALRALRYVLGLRETPLPKRLLLLGLVPSAAGLVLLARERGIDHVHIHSCASSAHLGALALLLGGPGYSLTLHGDLPIYGTDHRAKMRAARFVACVTRPLRDQVMAETGLEPARVPVVWMGVDTSRFASQPPKQPDASLRAIMVARLNWPKGHRFTAMALQRLKAEGLRVEFVVVGDGPYRPGIVGEVEAAGLSAETRFLGTLSEDEVARQIAAADVLLLPSVGIGEAAPVAVMEAMATGRPVVASIIGGTPDMITDGVDGFLCEPEDVDAITGRLRQLAIEPGLAARIGSAARARAVREFDATVLAARLLAQIRGSGGLNASGSRTPS